MMLISMILDPEACISDAGFFSVGPTNQPTDGQADSRSWITIGFGSWKGSMAFETGIYHKHMTHTQENSSISVAHQISKTFSLF